MTRRMDGLGREVRTLCCQKVRCAYKYILRVCSHLWTAIDYINELLSERQALVNRLHRAREALPPGHPVMTPSVEQPLWDREWKGGEGKYDAKADEDEEEEEESS